MSMPPPSKSDRTFTAHLLFGPRGLGGVNDPENDKVKDGKQVTVLNAREARAFIDAVSVYDGVKVTPDRRSFGMHGLHEMVAAQDVELIGGADQILTAYAKTLDLALNFGEPTAQTGAKAGRK